MRLVECIVTPSTVEQTAATAMAIIKKMKKLGVLMRDIPEKAGFVGNRMIFPYILESMLLLEGDPVNNIKPVSIAYVDFVVKKFGFLMGPFEMQDMSGLDVGYSIRKEFRSANHSKSVLSSRYSKIGDELYLAGRLGSKNQLGYYNYTDPKGKIVDQAVVDVISACSEYARKNFPLDKNELSEEYILERLIFPIVNEGFKVLEDLVLVSNRPGDVDIIYAHGTSEYCIVELYVLMYCI